MEDAARVGVVGIIRGDQGIPFRVKRERFASAPPYMRPKNGISLGGAERGKAIRTVRKPERVTGTGLQGQEVSNKSTSKKGREKSGGTRESQRRQQALGEN